MNNEQTEHQSLHISQEKLLALARAMIGGSRRREDDEDPLPPGPWDPVIRVALERIYGFGPGPQPWLERIDAFGPSPEPWLERSIVFGPQPEPWRVFGQGVPWRTIEAVFRSFGEEVALNPQPIPPRFAFLVSLARTLISRAELLQEIADATQRDGEQQGTVSAYVARFVDGLCGNDFRLKWPCPWPPPNWFAVEISGIDLVVMATQFDQAANETFNRELRQTLADAGAQLVEAGLAKLR